MMNDTDFDEGTETVAVKEDGRDLIATLRSTRYEVQDLRRHALERAVDLGEAGHRGGCPTTGEDVVADAELFYQFLRGT